MYLDKKFGIFIVLLVFVFSLSFIHLSQAENNFVFQKTLKIGITGLEVKELQKFLNTNGFSVSTSGVGSVGKETNYFGPATKAALIKFQKSINSLTPDGIAGKFTRDIVNKKNGTPPASPVPNNPTPAPAPIVIPTTPVNPAPPIVSRGGNQINYFNYSAGENGSISGITTQAVRVGANGSSVTAVANTGYHFHNWSDGVMTATRTDTNIRQNINVTANFSVIQLTISNPTITLSKTYDGGTTAVVTPGALSGVVNSEDVTVSAVATYDNSSVGTGKTITVLYTLGGAQAGNYIKPVNYTTTSGIINAIVINTAAISGVTAPVTGATPISTLADGTGYTATISWSGSPVTFAASTAYTSTITLTAKTGYTLSGVTENFFTVAGATATNSANTGVVSALFPATQAYATVPSSIILAVGSTAPVGGVTNVAIPAPGATDTTSAVTGWVTTTADKIKFTVTDNGGSSTITIGGGAYTSGADYQVPSTSSLTIVVTTTQASRATAVRTFTVTVAAWIPTIGASYQGGKVFYILQAGDPGYIAGQTHGLIAAIVNQGNKKWTILSYPFLSVPAPGARGTAIGTGLANTNAIISQDGAGPNTAAGLARDYNGGGYSDWYLPSKDELYKLYLNNTIFDNLYDLYDQYWSSSEIDDGHVYAYSLRDGAIYQYWKDGGWCVRAIRAF